MELNIPDALPVLSSGHHPVGSGKACVMDAISWLTDKPEQGDAPACVHPVLRSAAIKVNDALPDAERWKLWGLVPRLIGTADENPDPVARKILSVRLAIWCARQVAHLVREKDRAVCEKAVACAEAWCNDPTEENRKHVAYVAYVASADAASAYADAAYAAYAAAASAYAAAAAYAADADAYDADADAADAYDAYAAASAGSAARLQLFEGLIAEHERLTGHQPTPVFEAQWEELSDMLGVHTLAGVA